jgi:ABC-type polysaccharide/polyol phosphate transport system ATPase subunit
MNDLSPSDHSLIVDGVGKRYVIGTRTQRELWALRDVSFSVAPGTILGVIGPNGAGKTTLLKVLSRVTPPTAGRVRGRGRVVPLLALGAGFQQELSGRENVFLNAAMYGISAAEVEKRLDDIVEFAGIGDFIDMPVKKYSSGMYLRIAFSVAVNMRPDILLADEVLAVGDLEFQEKCLERVQQAGRDGMTVLFVSHDMNAITRLCDRVLWLNAGEIVKIGDPETIVAEYQNAAWSFGVLQKKGGAHKSRIGEILDVSLVSADGRPIGAVRDDEESRIRIVHRFTEPGFAARYTIHVRARGAVAFRSRSPEDVPIEPGVYAAEVTIPPGLLADTIYTVEVNVVGVRGGAMPPDDYVPMVAHNALTFQVFHPGSAQRDALGGVVAPRLKWELRQQAAGAAALPVASAAR